VDVLAHIFDPFVCLTLGIDNQRPPSAVEDEDAVVSGKTVGGETVFLPVSDLDLLREDSGEFVVVGNGDL